MLEKDKLLFSFLLTVKILEGSGELPFEEWFFLLTGGAATDTEDPNPAPEWLSEGSWGEFNRLDALSTGNFTGLKLSLEQNVDKWKEVYDRNDAHKATLPGVFGLKTPFQKLLILRCIRSDKMCPAIVDFIIDMQGKKFVVPPAFNLQACFEDSTALTPLIFVLSAGSDPMGNILKFSESKGVSLASISLGQGQGPKAEKLIERAQAEGSWMVCQNCHLAPSWMPAMEKIVEETTSGACHKDYRLWCTSYPSNDFPVAVLQNGVKMTMEPPKGLRQNMINSYKNDPIADEEFYASCGKGREFRKLVFALCFFHANVQERREYGALGWNNPYEYNNSDLEITVKQLAMFLDLYDDPYKALNYCTGQCNYGGRVTDDKDRRCLVTILAEYFHADILEDGYQLNASGTYCMPSDGSHSDYISYIEKFPLSVTPDVFGFHENATITKDQNETNTLFGSILLTKPAPTKAAGDDDEADKVENQGDNDGGEHEDEDDVPDQKGAVSRDDIIIEVASSNLLKLPAAFDMELAALCYPIKWEESMNTVFQQEVEKFNRLLAVVKKSLDDVQKAVKGVVVMSDELEKVGDALYFGKVPDLWFATSYPSLKPLAPYMNDLLERLKMMQKWLDTEPPTVFWLPGFFFTTAFLTGCKQNFSRKFTIPIDAIDFDFEFFSNPKCDTCQTRPEDGAYCSGLFFDGAQWDTEKMVMADPEPKVLFSVAPVIWMKPCETSKMSEYKHYNCPVYKTSERWGILATTGHSTNFVMYVRIPSDREQKMWIMAGIALLCQLDT